MMLGKHKIKKSGGDCSAPTSTARLKTPRPVAGGYGTSCASEGRQEKSFFDFTGRTENEMCSRLFRNAETGDSDKEALFASAGGVEVSEFLGGETGQVTRGARSRSWTNIEAFNV
ncbi:hypothetical protein [Mesobacillus selenatarsenatis]|uniref:hypothetical protein n=1 Tax=Mesobacillus selenatarsenatis TaxID=388741 RepID=UPI0012EC362E|nr:hypothetical protein [Mesobacillus selenatarsenatis]